MVAAKCMVLAINGADRISLHRSAAVFDLRQRHMVRNSRSHVFLECRLAKGWGFLRSVDGRYHPVRMGRNFSRTRSPALADMAHCFGRFGLPPLYGARHGALQIRGEAILTEPLCSSRRGEALVIVPSEGTK